MTTALQTHGNSSVEFFQGAVDRLTLHRTFLSTTLLQFRYPRGALLPCVACCCKATPNFLSVHTNGGGVVVLGNLLLYATLSSILSTRKKKVVHLRSGEREATADGGSDEFGCTYAPRSPPVVTKVRLIKRIEIAIHALCGQEGEDRLIVTRREDMVIAFIARHWKFREL